jgi:hypothetical protein
MLNIRTQLPQLQVKESSNCFNQILVHQQHRSLSSVVVRLKISVRHGLDKVFVNRKTNSVDNALLYSKGESKTSTMKEKQNNLVKILCIALPFVLGLAITYASGVLHLGAYYYPWSSYGFPLGWFDLAFSGGADFTSFFADFLFWSGIFAAAFWLFYYVNHALST